MSTLIRWFHQIRADRALRKQFREIVKDIPDKGDD